MRGFEVEVLADSQSVTRLTTMRWRYPRFIHSECMTHRMFSRNAASSRAIPLARMRRQVIENPAMPVEWGKAQKGMQAFETLDTFAAAQSQRSWLAARDAAVEVHSAMEAIGLAKQVANRILEPFMWMESIWSATEDGWASLLFQRDHRDAQPEFRHLARMIRAEYEASSPKRLNPGQWHLPYWRLEEGDSVGTFGRDIAVQVCAARCARVSYMTHEGVRDLSKDLNLFSRLVDRDDDPRHLSPLEHVAQCAPDETSSGNFGAGWIQLRKRYERSIPMACAGA